MHRTARHAVMRVGALLLTMPLAGSLLVPAAAQEAEASPIPIDESAVYVSSPTAALPRTLTSDVPPTAICVVVPEICPPEADVLRDPARDLVGEVAGSDVSTPVHPVAPDTIAVSFLGGATRYQSAILFETPTPPAGEEITQFDLVLPQEQPTYDMDSPAFRRVILGLFESVGPQDPQYFFDGFVDALQNREPVDLSQKIGIEACALLEPFEPSEPPATQSDEEMPQDEAGGPAIDCVFGGLGSFNEQALTWTFDLRFAARAWAAGDIPNHGVLLRPIGVQNLAFGDPDATTNAQVTLDITSATSAMATLPPPSPPPPVAPESPTLAGGTGFGPGDPVPLGLPPAAPPAAPPADPVAEPPAAAPSIVSNALAGGPVEQPWWMWLVLLAFAAGIRVGIAGFVGSESQVVGESSGALSHLLAKRGLMSGQQG